MGLTHGGEFWEYDSKPIDFSANINPLGPSRRALKAIDTDKVEHYPPQSSEKLKKALSVYSGARVEEIILGNGSVELIKDFCSIFLEKSDNSVIAQPAFSEYERYSKIFGGEVKNVFSKRGFEHTGDDIIEAAGNDTKIIFVCRPNNPTGWTVLEEDMSEILEYALKRDILLFVDEAFIEFSANSSLINRVRDFENLFVLRTLTKFFALPGLRIGYGIGCPKLIKLLESVKSPWNINIFAHDAAIASLRDKRFIEGTKEFIKKEKIFLKKGLEELNVKVYESDANFFLLRHEWNSREVKKDLLKEGILIRDCSSFSGLDTRYIRLCIRNRSENLRLIRSLKAIVARGVKKGTNCEYYPCHFEGQDCTFCFCIFYPCMDKSRGSFVTGKDGKKVWTCKNCRDIHDLKTVKKILKASDQQELESLDFQERLKIKEGAMEGF